MDGGNNKIKDGDTSMTNKMEEMRKAQDSQLGIAGPSKNPFLQPIK
jgi:hypothetical protein